MDIPPKLASYQSFIDNKAVSPNSVACTMTDHSPTLSQILVTDLPPGFVRSLIARFPLIYNDAYAAVYNNPDYGKPEADYLLGHYRRALAEATLRNHGVEHRLKVRMEKSEHGGCEHVRVVAGRLSLTICHITSQGAFPRYSHSREQYSLINQHLSQRQLFPVDSEPRNADLYGIILHTEIPGQKDKFKSLSVGFPNHEFNAWVQEPIDLLDISDIQSRKFQKQEDLQRQVQDTNPKWKIYNNKKLDEEER